MPPTCVGGPHLRAVNLIHEVGRNLARPRRQNDTTAIYSGHADRDRSVETAAIQRANEGVIKGSSVTSRKRSDNS